MKTEVIYPGTFDPVTRGHVDLIRRSCGHFSRVIVAIAESTHKQAYFTTAERLTMMQQATRKLPLADRIEVVAFSGLLVSFMRSRRVHVALRGLRAISDFEYEFQLAQMNRKMDPDFEIIYMMPDEKYTYISSSLVKEVASLGGDVSEFLPEEIHAFFQENFSRRAQGGVRA